MGVPASMVTVWIRLSNGARLHRANQCRTKPIAYERRYHHALAKLPSISENYGDGTDRRARRPDELQGRADEAETVVSGSG